ncbi:MAG: GHKL domain-containing protein [Clostridia bacterium]|nr:GHKL domain-containing protein [Clostridia bacterium]
MRDLVESLFELTKVSSGVLESRRDEIDLVRLLEQTIGLFDDQLTEAGLVVRRNYSADSIPAITDGARMHQVFANLLGNAIKYALQGTRIYLDVTESDDSYRIRMTNTASYEMDFKPEEIMQRFARGDKARSTKGSGLGLAIAQTYTESVGGQFHVAVDGDQFSAVVTLPKTERDL